jgi:protoporphyrinogen oxidase
MKRRQFIQLIPLAAAMRGLAGCAANNNYPVIWEDEQAATGHLLRDGFVPPAASIKNETDILIIGAGVSGLSAARRFTGQGVEKIMVIDVAEKPGGNARGGKNEVSAFPWAAHYLPLPSPELIELHEFLKQSRIITGEVNGLPVYEETYLCADPKERLYLQGAWQEGIIPHQGLPKDVQTEVQRFMDEVHPLRDRTGNDGVYLFNIPASRSSFDARWRDLDKISAKDWLNKNNYRSDALHWYINYCCRDDYGSSYENTSAWAMLHYFCARRAQAHNARGSEVLTWPEGNQFLINKLVEQSRFDFYGNQLALQVKEIKDGYAVTHYNSIKKQTTETICRQLVLAVPAPVAIRLLPTLFPATDSQQFVHYPWLVANITFSKPTEKEGYPAAWDNVIYQTPSLGYVTATHQQSDLTANKKVITYYKPLSGKTARDARLNAYERSKDAWLPEIIDELKLVHSDIENKIEEVRLKLWGHGMIAPVPGFLFSPLLEKWRLFKNPKMALAHTDYCGISIFEEAFYAGWEAAGYLLQNRP